MSETGAHMIQAAKKGDVKSVEKLLEEGADVHYADGRNRTALHHAAMESAADVCEVLLAHRANVDAVDRWNRTALHNAAIYSAADVCEVLIAHRANVDAVDKYNQTALHLAAINSAADVCEVLLAHRANVEVEDKYNRTALHCAAINSAADVCEVLIAHRANVDAEDSLNQTALHYAAIYSAADVCEVLIAHRANVDAVDDDNQTALHLAAIYSAADVCEVLLAHRANVDAEDSLQRTPMHYACKEYNSASPSEHLKRLQLIVILLRAKADIASKDKDGKTPLDFLSASKRKTIQQEYDNFTTVHKLMQGEGRPMDVVKICLCGDPAAGKTTIKSTLTKSEVEADYILTPGINVSKQSVADVGNFVIWDFAGQKEYSITHGMFLGATAQSIFLVLYDLSSEESTKASIQYWLPFIRAAAHGQEEKKPQIILVGTHVDKHRNLQSGERSGRRVLEEAKKKGFEDTLDIDDAVIVVDARKEDCIGMTTLRKVLKRRREETIRNKTIPLLCDKVQALIQPLRIEGVKVIGWKQYLRRTKAEYGGVDEETLKLVTNYLHILGEVYWAKFTDREDQIILDTQWFTTDIIGEAFAGDEFEAFDTLENKALYTRKDLEAFFPSELDISILLALLDDMDLVHVTADNLYLLPGKLPGTDSEVAVDTPDAFELKGQSIECAEEIDIINPNVFPSIQKKILDHHRQACEVSCSAVKCRFGRVVVHVKLTKRKRAINVVVIYPMDAREESHSKLVYMVELIQIELTKKSKGTNLRYGYISQNALQINRNLENLWSFTKDELIKAEDDYRGMVYKDPKSKPEDITKILFMGYDLMPLREIGPDCRYNWLPIKAWTNCFQPLDNKESVGENYRAIGEALGLQDHEVDECERLWRRGESITDNLIKYWCTERKRKMSICMLQQLLSWLSLVKNAGALNAINEVVEEYAPNMQKTEERTGHEAFSDARGGHAVSSSSDLVTPKVADRFPVKGASVYHSYVNMGPSPQSAARPTVPSDSITPNVADRFPDKGASVYHSYANMGPLPQSAARPTVSSDSKVTEVDVLDIVDIFTLANLDDVCIRLGLTRKDLADIDTHNLKKRAQNLLYLWCDRNGQKASRRTFIKAVEMCKDCKAGLDELKGKWNI